MIYRRVVGLSNTYKVRINPGILPTLLGNLVTDTVVADQVVLFGDDLVFQNAPDYTTSKTYSAGSWVDCTRQ